MKNKWWRFGKKRKYNRKSGYKVTAWRILRDVCVFIKTNNSADLADVGDFLIEHGKDFSWLGIEEPEDDDKGPQDEESGRLEEAERELDEEKLEARREDAS